MNARIVDWLRAQLDEDDRIASAAAGGTAGHWKTSGGGVEYGDGPDDWPEGSGNGVVVYDEGAPSRAEAAHIARYDPARVLAEVAAKRRVLDLHQRVDARADWFGRDRPDEPAEPACYGCGANFGEEYAIPNANDCPVVRLLAVPYADRAGYEQQWRPEPTS